MEGIFWLIVIIVMALIEIITLGLTTIWFAGGALVAFFANLAGANLVIQIILFVVVSVLLLALTRPLAVEYLNKGRTRTNVDSLLGMDGSCSPGGEDPKRHVGGDYGNQRCQADCKKKDAR